MRKPPGDFLLEPLGIPLRMQRRQLPSQNLLSRSPESESDRQTLSGCLAPENLRHRLLHHLDPAWIKHRVVFVPHCSLRSLFSPGSTPESTATNWPRPK